jgi:hypothetical protein
MDQKVKLQVSSDLADVPRLSGLMLQQSVMDAANVLSLLEQTVQHLKHTDPLDEEQRQKLKSTLETLGVINSLLIKLDLRINDTASIVAGLISIFEKPSTETEQSETKTEEEKDASVISG